VNYWMVEIVANYCMYLHLLCWHYVRSSHANESFNFLRSLFYLFLIWIFWNKELQNGISTSVSSSDRSIEPLFIPYKLYNVGVAWSTNSFYVEWSYNSNLDLLWHKFYIINFLFVQFFFFFYKKKKKKNSKI
jgi:hypothetical protein